MNKNVSAFPRAFDPLSEIISNTVNHGMSINPDVFGKFGRFVWANFVNDKSLLLPVIERNRGY